MNEPRDSPDAVIREFHIAIVAADAARHAGEQLHVDRPLVIGREPTCDLVLADPSVSRRHARVEPTPSGLKITDLGSGNGVWVGTQRVTGIVLQPGQRARIGSTVFECRQVDRQAPAPPPPIVHRARGEEAPRSGGFVVRVLTAGDHVKAGEVFHVTRVAATIGRAPDCDVVLAEADISRKHAKLEIAAGGFRITDLGSACGTWLDDRQVDVGQVAPGQRVRIGRRVVIECHTAEAETLAEAPPAAAPVAAQPVAPSPVVSPPPAVVRPPAGPAPAATPPLVARVPETAPEDATIAARPAVPPRQPSPPVAPPVPPPAPPVAPAEVEATPDDATRVVPSPAIAASHAAPPPAEPVPDDATMAVPVDVARAAAPPPTERPFEAEDATRMIVPGAVAASRAPVTGPAPAEAVPDDATQVVTAAQMAALARPPAAPAPPATEPDDATRMVPAARAQAAASPPREEEDATRVVTAADVGRAPAPVSDAVTAEAFEEALSHTVVMRVPVPAAATSRSLEEEGEEIRPSAHKPLLLDDPALLYYVVTGSLLVFSVEVRDGVPVGQRTHLLGVLEKQGCFGFDTKRYGLGMGMVVLAKPGTVLRAIPLRRLQEIARDATMRPAVVALVDTWVNGMSKSLIRSLPTRRTGEVELKSQQEATLGPRQKATSGDGVLWLDIWNGSVLFNDLTTPTFSRKRVLFPLTPHSWVQPVGDEFGDLEVTPLPTEAAVTRADMWHGFSVFQEVLYETECGGQLLSTADEFVRLQQKAQHAEAAEAAGYGAIGAVLRAESETPEDLLTTTAAEPVFAACVLVGQALGMTVRSHLEGTEQLAFEDLVNSIGSASGFRTRVVALHDDWYRRDYGPMLGQLGEAKSPVALLPTGPRAFELVDPKTGTRRKVDAALAAELSPFGVTLYRPLPPGMLGARELIAFGARGQSREFLTVALMAVVLGVLGTVTPYFTGQLFDQAIPQADRGALYVYTLALFASAVATSAFKFTQGIATVRVQAKMESTIQASVWDRLLDLPVNFFRTYPAGDLADRAAGVDQIQELVSGAGISAILGSVSGLFYVVQMFLYNLKLALLAIFLTIVYVGTTTLLNYLQLRYQRRELQLRGRISGLVLNLIGGVSKLRVCGAERHAFRVWAEQFAAQRRITFSVGSIQNVAATFSTAFPVLSSIMIFLMMVSEMQAAAETGQPGLTVGEFVAFNTAYGLFLGAMQALGDASLSLLRVVPIYERLSPLVTTPPEVDASKAYPGRLKGEIEINNVRFRYTPDGPFIINGLSLKIRPGDFVAFVGGSGCGKSTLMRLMLGFEHPTSGTIYYDGQDLGTLDLRLVRQQIGVVLQISRVMPTDIWRNITGATARTIDDAWWAAERAGLADDVRNMPMGMHTYVSEGGGTLSGGQRQRLMIARAIVNRPKIMFLDEATSALDNRTQAIVTESMNKLEATRIVIAHRLSTIIDANKICYLEAGQIVEMGSYEELMALNGKFAELARRQVV